MMTLDEYMNSKPGFTFVESLSRPTRIKYEKGSVLTVPYDNIKYTYTILGFIQYTSGYLRYVGELRDDHKILVKVTSRDIKDVDKDYRLSLTSILKEL